MNFFTENARLGQLITTLREQKAWTQQEFAQKLQTSQSAVARMEKGEQNFSTGMLLKISRVFNREIISLGGQTLNFRITGGHKLKGVIATNTSKNSAIAIMAACLLNQGKSVLRGVPKIEEVFRMIEVLSSIGAQVSWVGSNDLEIKCEAINPKFVNKEAASKTRAALMMIGSLVHSQSRFQWPLSGGCKLGARTVRPHLYALEKLGVNIKTVHDHYEIRATTLNPAEVVLYETGDTVTENLLLAAAKIPGQTTLKLASANYMVQDLCYFLMKLGVKIEGIGSQTLKIKGIKHINKRVEFSISEDPIESMLFLSLSATTNSSLVIQRCPIDFLRLELLKLEKMGFRYKIIKEYKSRNGLTNLVDIQTFSSQLTALEEKLHPLPSSAGINIDNLPFFVPIATQAKGQTLIHDWVYENRAIYYMELNKLRAKLILADPHRVFVEGKSELKGTDMVCPPALRPAAIILIAMLAAKGSSILRNVYSINRGYEDLATRLKKLGAKIELVTGFSN